MAFEGKVVDGRWEPVAGVRVVVSRRDATEPDLEVREVRTDREGRFSFSSLERGGYDVTCFADGYPPLRRAVWVVADPTKKRFVLEVFQARVIDSRGEPVGGARVEVRGNLTTHTDENGVFGVISLELDPTFVKIDARGCLPFERDYALAELPDEFVVQRGATLRILTREAGTRLNLTLSRLSGAPTSSGATLTTDDGGVAELTGFPTGVFRCHLDDGFDGESYVVELSPDRVAEVEFRAEAPMSFRILVVDESGAPVPDARLMIFRAHGPSGSEFGTGVGTTDVAGVWSTERLGPGGFDVAIQAAGFAPRVERIEPSHGGEQRIALLRGGTLRVRVLERGVPVPSVEVKLWALRPGRSDGAHTDDKGEALFFDIGDVAYSIRLERGEDAVGGFVCLGRSGRETIHVFEWPSTFPIRGSIRENGRPLTSVPLELRGAKGVTETRTDERGEFETRVLGFGPVDVAIRRERGSLVLGSVNPGSSTPARFELETHTVEVELVGPLRDQPIDVHFEPIGGRGMRTVARLDAGKRSVRIPSVPAGRYLLQAVGHPDPTTNLSFDSSGAHSSVFFSQAAQHYPARVVTVPASAPFLLRCDLGNRLELPIPGRKLDQPLVHRLIEPAELSLLPILRAEPFTVGWLPGESGVGVVSARGYAPVLFRVEAGKLVSIDPLRRGGGIRAVVNRQGVEVEVPFRCEPLADLESLGGLLAARSLRRAQDMGLPPGRYRVASLLAGLDTTREVTVKDRQTTVVVLDRR